MNLVGALKCELCRRITGHKTWAAPQCWMTSVMFLHATAIQQYLIRTHTQTHRCTWILSVHSFERVAKAFRHFIWKLMNHIYIVIIYVIIVWNSCRYTLPKTMSCQCTLTGCAKKTQNRPWFGRLCSHTGSFVLIPVVAASGTSGGRPSSVSTCDVSCHVAKYVVCCV